MITALIGPLTANEWAYFRCRQNPDDDALICCAETSDLRDALFHVLRQDGCPTAAAHVLPPTWETMTRHGWPTGDTTAMDLLTRIATHYGLPNPTP